MDNFLIMIGGILLFVALILSEVTKAGDGILGFLIGFGGTFIVVGLVKKYRAKNNKPAKRK
ncbi:hypothetical protein [Lagierella sp.]|uniref:hypothetical protein n=1 Tax=Lagierella sp. TaxID=2849657 RepID=UPI00260C6760|nr:hypothetical protein [Lagierella sp.]